MAPALDGRVRSATKGATASCRLQLWATLALAALGDMLCALCKLPICWPSCNGLEPVLQLRWQGLRKTSHMRAQVCWAPFVPCMHGLCLAPCGLLRSSSNGPPPKRQYVPSSTKLNTDGQPALRPRAEYRQSKRSSLQKASAKGSSGPTAIKVMKRYIPSYKEYKS